jgi:tetratricopeptide (TPR) repeat protein
MLEDAQGLAVTTDSPAAIAALNRFTQQSLGYGNAAETALLQGNAADRECVLIHAYTAAYYLAQEEAISRKRAIPHLNAAQRRLGDITEREYWTVQAISAWAEGNINRAISWHQAIVETYPQDLLAVQQAQYHYFYQGESTLLLKIAEKALKVAERSLVPNAIHHYLYGMMAFGLEQCHQLAAAEAMGHRAIALNRYDPWAHHAIAHALDAQGRIDEGITWMERHADTWSDCNSMLYTHNWWHIALYYLAKGAFQTVLNLYDVHLWGRARKDSPKDQVGAIATLLRLELQGVDVGHRWQDLSHYLTPRLHEHFLPLQDLHALYALARTDQTDAVTIMLESMKRHAQTVHVCERAAWAEVALPAAKGMVAYALGHWSAAIAHLKPILPRLHTIGGSHTQRDVFWQLYLDALQKNEHHWTLCSFAGQRFNPAQEEPSNRAPALAAGWTSTPKAATIASYLAPRSAVYRTILHSGGHIGC